jgi:hypothetical protein
MPVALDPSAEGECTQLGEEKMANGISFPFEFVDLGTVTPPFKITSNPDFPTETDPVCILTNTGTPPAPDNFITIGSAGFPNDPDPWELTFHWATVGPTPAAGTWQLDAFLDLVSVPGISVVLPGFPTTVAGVNPQKYNITIKIPPAAFAFPPPGIFFLARLYATLRWDITGSAPIVRVSGRAIGPLIDFYQPE